MVLARKRIQAVPFNASRGAAAAGGRPRPLAGFVPAAWRRRSGSVVAAAAHFEPRRQIEGAVHDEPVPSAHGPTDILADWGMAPRRLAATEWLQKWGTAVVQAPGAYGRDKGQGLFLDYALVKAGLEAAAQLAQIPAAPRGTRVGHQISVIKQCPPLAVRGSRSVFWVRPWRNAAPSQRRQDRRRWGYRPLVVAPWPPCLRPTGRAAVGLHPPRVFLRLEPPGGCGFGGGRGWRGKAAGGPGGSAPREHRSPELRARQPGCH